MVRPECQTKLPVAVEPLDNSSNRVEGEFKQINQGIAGGIGLRLVERYIESELYILVVFAVRGEPRNFAALVKKESEIDLPSVPNIAPRSDMRRVGSNGKQRSMFVKVVELVQSPENFILSSIRLQPFDDLLHLIPHAVYLSLVSGYLIDGGWDVIDDWKSSGRGRLSTASYDELPRQIVQRTAEIVDNVARNQGNMVRNRLGLRHINDVLSSIRITLCSESIRFAVLEGRQDIIQVIDVLIGPLDF